MIKAFKIISYLEGISYLLLLFVGVPLKYIGQNEILVKKLGMPHGLLFVAYIFMAIVVRQMLKWDLKTFVIVLLASVVPFGTFYVDRKYLSK
jgi:integral membrane protein